MGIFALPVKSPLFEYKVARSSFAGDAAAVFEAPAQAAAPLSSPAPPAEAGAPSPPDVDAGGVSSAPLAPGSGAAASSLGLGAVTGTAPPTTTSS